jgi:hypothetical protein
MRKCSMLSTHCRKRRPGARGLVSWRDTGRVQCSQGRADEVAHLLRLSLSLTASLLRIIPIVGSCPCAQRPNERGYRAIPKMILDFDCQHIPNNWII